MLLLLTERSSRGKPAVLDLFMEADVPTRIRWTEAQDMEIRRMRAERISWDAIATAVGVTRWTAIERGRRLGARPPPRLPPEPPPIREDPERASLPPGHPETWGIIIKGTSLEGMPYPIPAPIR
jgi:hypothetical protein